jgi:2',3'-cyclic-nucleotide 2'-phosphodiesterase (5'-nucleotidase family)
VLLLDGGAVFDNQQDTAGLMVKAMNMLKYDVLNIGAPELSFGKDFLEHTHADYAYVASNLLYEGAKIPWMHPYVVKEAGGIKVAILGILDPDDLKLVTRQDHVEGFEVLPPATVLNSLVPEVRKRVDLVVLLSQLDTDKTSALAESVQGLDVVIAAGENTILNLKPLKNPILLKAAAKGTMLGMVKISLDEKGAIHAEEPRNIDLNNLISDDKEITSLVKEFKEERATRAERLKKELLKGLELSPEEFMKKHNEEQIKRKGVNQ